MEEEKKRDQEDNLLEQTFQAFCTILDTQKALYGPEMKNLLPAHIDIKNHISDLLESMKSFQCAETLFSSKNPNKMKCLEYLVYIFKESLQKMLTGNDQGLKGVYKYFFYKLPYGKELKKFFMEFPATSPNFSYLIAIMEDLLEFQDKKGFYHTFSADLINNEIVPYKNEQKIKNFLVKLLKSEVFLAPYQKLNQLEGKQEVNVELVRDHMNEILEYPIFVGNLPHNVNGLTLLNKAIIINKNLLELYFMNDLLWRDCEDAETFELVIISIVIIHEWAHAKRIIGYAENDLGKKTPKKFRWKLSDDGEAGFYVEEELFGLAIDIPQLSLNPKAGLLLKFLQNETNWFGKKICSFLKTDEELMNLTNKNAKTNLTNMIFHLKGKGILKII